MNISSRLKIESLKKKDAIDDTFKKGIKIKTKIGPVFFLKCNHDAKIKIAIFLRRSIKSAVRRNYIKRIFRSAIREIFQGEANFTRMIFIYNGPLNISYKDMVSELCIIEKLL